jgi:SAM dependent carboxyl methyltransferase
MAKGPGTIVPTAMEGHGGYNRSSQVQAGGLSPAVPLLEEAARMVTLPGQMQTLLIADYGSSQGHNSLLPLSTAISIIRERTATAQAISVAHTDLPQNDFTVLFQTLNTDPESYLRRYPDTYAMAIGRSFYEQILPSGSVTLGWSSWAVQWLSRAPSAIPDQVQVAFSKDPATRARFAQQAAEDWQNFLLARSRELSPGGRLVILTMATDQGNFGYEPLLAALYRTLEEMARGGFLQPKELHRMTIPTVGRSREDLMAPFISDGHCGRLRPQVIEVFHAEDHIWSEYERHGDARELGRQWAAFSRGSVFPTLVEALEEDAGKAAEFTTRLEAGIIDKLAKKPERMVIPLARMLLVNDGEG